MLCVNSLMNLHFSRFVETVLASFAALGSTKIEQNSMQFRSALFVHKKCENEFEFFSARNITAIWNRI